MRRPAQLAFAALVLASVVASCARPRTKAPDEIVFWEPWAPSVVAPYVQRFEAGNPSLRVRVRQVPLAQASDSLAAALAAGHPPDLCAIASADMPRWLASGSLVDWSAGVADLRDSLRGWPLCTVGDALYGLPWLLRPRVLLLQPALFARAGLDAARPPETWAQLRAAAAKVQKLGGGVRGFGIARGDSVEDAAEFLSFAWGNGAELLSAGLDSSRFDSPEAAGALEFYASLGRVALVAPRDTLLRELGAGRLGMMLGDAAAAAPAHAAVALVPRPAAGQGTHAAFADGVVLASFTGSKRKEAALRLARALASPATLPALAAGTGGLQPAIADPDSAPLPPGAPPARVAARQCAGARFAPPVARWDSIRAAIADAVGDALDDRASAADAVARAGERIDASVGRK